MSDNIALLLAYDGTHFFGWQRTSSGPSVEESLQQVLERVLQKKITLQAASRTDAGVHAEGQVVNFQTQNPPPDLSRLAKSCNSLLGGPIVIRKAWRMPDSFHATLDVRAKTYAYHICRSPFQLPQRRFYSWHVPGKLNLEAMRQAADELIGVRDFTSFCNQRKNLVYPHKTRRIFSIKMHTEDLSSLVIEIAGDHFLYKMARTVAGTLVDVGLGKFNAAQLQEILLAKSRPLAGQTAPAHGLFLKKVDYPDFHFSHNELSCFG